MNILFKKYFPYPSPFQICKYLAVLTVLFLTGCEKPQDTSESKAYYDLKGFIETQISFLSEENPKVSKKMSVSGKSEDRTTKTVNWKKELELFVQADINKPSYGKSYVVTRPDSLTSVYTLKENESLPVKYLKITLDKTTGNPVLIHALLLSENQLYQSEKDITMHCSDLANKWSILSYTIKGYQKLATMDKKDFNIEASVEY